MHNYIWNLAEVDPATIANILHGKGGVYQWTNNISGKTYIGSSFDLRRRFLVYININTIIMELARGESLIYRALIKYGYSAFSFQILEFYEPSPELSQKEQRDALLVREQAYIDLFNPEYNILQTAGSNLGHSMSESAKAKISASKKGKPNHRKGGTHSQKAKDLIKQNNAISKHVFVYDSSLVFITVFSSIADAATFTGISRDRIGRAMKKNMSQLYPINGYIFRNSPL